MSKSFDNTVIVTCNVLKKEMEKLKEEGFLNASDILYVSAGSHEKSSQMEEELPERLKEASEKGDKIIVALGTKCYFNFNEPEKNIDSLISGHSEKAVRLDVEDCFDMLADKETRKSAENGRKVYWLTPGWMDKKDEIFGHWDQGKANETFPMNDTAVLLDPLDYFNHLSIEDPETLLGFSDWMQIGIEPYPVTLERLSSLLEGALEE
jgi:hypothetical protein